MDVVYALFNIKGIEKSMNGRTLYYIAKTNDIKIIKKFFEFNKKIDINTKHICGTIMLDTAIDYCSNDIINLYLEQENISFDNQEYFTAISMNNMILCLILQHPNFKKSRFNFRAGIASCFL